MSLAQEKLLNHVTTQRKKYCSTQRKLKILYQTTHLPSNIINIISLYLYCGEKGHYYRFKFYCYHTGRTYWSRSLRKITCIFCGKVHQTRILCRHNKIFIDPRFKGYVLKDAYVRTWVGRTGQYVVIPDYELEDYNSDDDKEESRPISIKYWCGWNFNTRHFKGVAHEKHAPRLK